MRLSKGVDVASGGGIRPIPSAGGGSEPVGGAGSGPMPMTAALQTNSKKVTRDSIAIEADENINEHRTSTPSKKRPVTQRHEKND
ncbi:MAG: hypothetical protein GY847_17875 [Proteobacteria bacterium]|nr:hypothetical protein [Pseudomonadota bacterium]